MWLLLKVSELNTFAENRLSGCTPRLFLDGNCLSVPA
jgi:hypothetical protein